MMGPVRFDPPAIPAVLLRRYKRFLADVQLEDGRLVTAHCSNTGRMTGCSSPGSSVLVTPLPSGKKLRWKLRLVKSGRCWVNVDTQVPNQVIAQAARRQRLTPLSRYDTVAREVPYGANLKSRIDILLTDSAGVLPPCYIEVKNVTLRIGRTALFPDAVTERGLKHLRELQDEVQSGHRAILLPFIARADCDNFAGAAEIDPSWTKALAEVTATGVEVHPWKARIDRHGVSLGHPIPWTGE